MAQITIYLDDELLKAVKRGAKASGMSKSKWVAEAVRARTRKEWPEEFRRLAGSWPDAPLVEEIRKHYGVDLPREKL